jgi:Winged helix-turn-helix DNA-binding
VLVTAALVELARAELARVEEEYRLAREAYAREKREFQAEIARLRRIIRVAEPRPVRSAAVQAGPAAIERVRAAVVEAGRRASQAQVTRATGLNPGTVTYALRALVEAGELVATGLRVDGSREFRLARRARREAA